MMVWQEMMTKLSLVIHGRFITVLFALDVTVR